MDFVRNKNNNKIIGFSDDNQTIISDSSVAFSDMVKGDENLLVSTKNSGENYATTKYNDGIVVWQGSRHILLQNVSTFTRAVTNGFAEAISTPLQRSPWGDTLRFSPEKGDNLPIFIDEWAEAYFSLESIDFNGRIGNLSKEGSFFNFQIKKFEQLEKRSNTQVGVYINRGKYEKRGIDLPPVIANKMRNWCWQLYHSEFLTIFGGLERDLFEREKGREETYKKIQEWKEKKGWKNVTQDQMEKIFQDFGLEEFYNKYEGEYVPNNIAKFLANLDEVESDGASALVGLLIAYLFFKK